MTPAHHCVVHDVDIQLGKPAGHAAVGVLELHVNNFKMPGDKTSRSLRSTMRLYKNSVVMNLLAKVCDDLILQLIVHLE